MTPQQFRSSYSYQGAIELGPQIVEITEELPAHEQTGLMMQLHRLMVALPASIAADLTTGSSTRSQSFFELVAAIDLIDRIYPALDTAEFRQDLLDLGARLHGDGFGELPASATDVDDDDEPSNRLTKQTDTSAPAESVQPAAAPQFDSFSLGLPPTGESAAAPVTTAAPQPEFVPPAPQSPEAIAAAQAASAVPLTGGEPAAVAALPVTAPAGMPFADGTPEPTPRTQVTITTEPAPQASVPLVKIDPVSALPTTRVQTPGTQGTTVHVQPNSLQ